MDAGDSPWDSNGEYRIQETDRTRMKKSGWSRYAVRPLEKTNPICCFTAGYAEFAEKRTSTFSAFPAISAVNEKHVQKCSKVFKNCQKLTKIHKNLREYAKPFVKSC